MQERLKTWGFAAVTTLVFACASGPPSPQSPAAHPTSDTDAAPSAPETSTSKEEANLAPPTYEVQTETVEAVPVLQVRVEVAPNELGDRFAETFGALYPYAVQQGATPTGVPYGCYHEFTAARVVVDIGVPLSQAVAGSGDMQPGELPAGEVAFSIHEGSYQHLKRAHDAIKQWLERNGRKAKGIPCDLYEVGPGQTASDRDYRTRVVYWLEPE